MAGRSFQKTGKQRICPAKEPASTWPDVADMVFERIPGPAEAAQTDAEEFYEANKAAFCRYFRR